MKALNRSKLIQNKSKGYLSGSIISSGGITGKSLEIGSIMLLDGKYEVAVKSQRVLKHFTTVSYNEKIIEVRTERLTEKK